MAGTNQFKFEFPKNFVKYSVAIVAALIVVAYIITAAKFSLVDFGIIIGFILIGAAGRLPERFSPVALGIELVSVFTIISAIKYGFFAGAIVGAAAFIISGVFTLERPQDVLIAVIGFIGMAYFAPVAYAFFGVNLGYMAIALTIGYDVFTGALYFFTGYNIVHIIRFSILHIIANYFIISYLGAKLIGV